MKYIYEVTDTKDRGDEFTILYTNDQDEAVNAARNAWECMTRNDKKHSRIEVRKYAEAFDPADDTRICYDYDTIEWRLFYVVTKGTFDREQAECNAESMKLEGQARDIYIAVMDMSAEPRLIDKLWVF